MEQKANTYIVLWLFIWIQVPVMFSLQQLRLDQSLKWFYFWKFQILFIINWWLAFDFIRYHTESSVAGGCLSNLFVSIFSFFLREWVTIFEGSDSELTTPTFRTRLSYNSDLLSLFCGEFSTEFLMHLIFIWFSYLRTIGL